MSRRLVFPNKVITRYPYKTLDSMYAVYAWVPFSGAEVVNDLVMPLRS